MFATIIIMFDTMSYNIHALSIHPVIEQSFQVIIIIHVHTIEKGAHTELKRFNKYSSSKTVNK